MGAGRLKGRRIVVTRPRDRAAALVAGLEAEGAEVILFPAIGVVGPTDPGPLKEAAGRLAEYDWVVLTSAYGARALADARAGIVGVAPGGAPRPRIGCVGAATAEAAREAGWAVDVVPEETTGAGLARALEREGAGRGARVLFPRAADAREDLPRLLREAGAVVDEVEAYRKTGPVGEGEPLREALSRGTIDLLTFTSPSTVHNFSGFFGEQVRGVPAVVIGPTTAEAAEAAGLRVAGVARETTTDGLIAAVLDIFNR